MISSLSRLALVSIVAGAFASTALAQTSVSVDRTGGNMIRTKFTVELRDAAGNWSGRAVIDHPGMGIMARSGYIPQPQLGAVEQAVIAADLYNQAGEEWTGRLPDISTETFTDQDQNYSILHPMSGPNGVDVTPEMVALSQAMSDAQQAFQFGAAPPAATAFLEYVYAGAWLGEIKLEVLSDGAMHLQGFGGGLGHFGGIDVHGQLSQSQVGNLHAYIKARAAIWANYTSFGRMIPDMPAETITYTDDNGTAKAVTKFSNGVPGRTWRTLERYLKGEAETLDPSITPHMPK